MTTPRALSLGGDPSRGKVVESDTAVKLLRSFVADIEAMQDGYNSNQFGPFDCEIGGKGDSLRTNIEWPNLAYLLDRARKIL